jgi:hypothetical protein
MPQYDHILEKYSSLREAGTAPKIALSQLQTDIRLLPQQVKEALAQDIRKYEGKLPQQTVKKPAVKTLRPKPGTDPKPIRLLQTASLPREYCWQCGKPNRQEALLCAYCGVSLNPNKNASTKRLNTNNHAPEHFPVDNVLLLRIPSTNDDIQVRPQDARHEVILGRIDAKGVVRPDIDLTPYRAAELGVSRMHLALQYDANAQVIHIGDMDSANGLYVNGQRLTKSEKRVLRDGDQLRLGELVINVFFVHENNI